MPDQDGSQPGPEEEEQQEERWTSTPPPPADRRGGGSNLPPPPPEPSFAEQMAAMDEEEAPPPQAPPSQAPPSQAPPSQAPPSQAPPPQAPPSQAPPSQAPPPVEEATGLAGPEFTALRDTPMELVDEEDEDGEGGGKPTAPPGKAAPENVATEWAATAPGSHRSVAGGRVNFKRLAVVALVAVAAFFGLKAVLPKPAAPEKLAIEFAQGSQTRYRVFVTYKGERTLSSGKSIPLALNLHATVDLSVAEVKGDVATVDVTMTNVYASGPSPFFRHVPPEYHTQIVVSKDGSIRSGQLGLANAMIGYLAPGWDLLFPLLPKETVLEGATWSASEQVPVTSDASVPVTSQASLLGVLESGNGVSIVTAKVTAPVSAEVKLSDVAASIGVKPADYGVAPGTDPSLAFDGSITMDLTARIDAAAGVVNDMYLKGTSSYDVTASGIPGMTKKDSTSTFDVDMSVRISKQTPKPSGQSDQQGQ